MTRPYFELALGQEGRRLDPAAAKACAGSDLLFCSSAATNASSPGGGGLGVVGCAPCPLAPVAPPAPAGAPPCPLLPRDLGGVLRKALGPQAIDEFRWRRVPAVALVARGAVPEPALAAAALAGVPVSPSLAGPHAEQVPTVVEVFLKGAARGGRFPDCRLFLLREGGFLALGADIDEAAAAFAHAARARLLGEDAYAAVSEACGLAGRAASGPGLAPTTSGGSAASAPASAGAALAAAASSAAAAAASAVAASASAAGGPPTLDAFEGLGSGAFGGAAGGGTGSHPLLMLGSAGGAAGGSGGVTFGAAGGGGGTHAAVPSFGGTLGGGGGRHGDTARAVPLFSLGGAATALRRMGHSLLGGRPTVGGRVSDGAAAEIIPIGGSAGGNGGGGRGGGHGTARAGAARASLPGLRGLFPGGGGGGMAASPFALPSAGPPSAAGAAPASARARSQGNVGALAPAAGGGGERPPCAGGGGMGGRKGSETSRPLPSFTSGGLKPW